LLRIDAAAVKRESHLDGKWLLRTSDTTLTPEDLAAAYKQLLQVERGWREMKGALGLRPVFHYREDRIRAHVQLCWLALLLLRVVENATDDTWRNVRPVSSFGPRPPSSIGLGETWCQSTWPLARRSARLARRTTPPDRPARGTPSAACATRSGLAAPSPARRPAAPRPGHARAPQPRRSGSPSAPAPTPP